MTINLNDVLELQYNFSQSGITGKMIQYQKITVVTSDPDGQNEANFARDTFAYVASNFAQMLSAGGTFDSVYVRNRTNPLFEGYSDQNPVVGTGSGLGAPFVTISIFQSRATTATRNGYKRFPFVAENRVTGGVPQVPALVETFLEEYFGEGGIVPDAEAVFTPWTYQNLIIPRILAGVPPVYVPDYANGNGILLARINTVTTQNSRKT